MDFRLTDRVCRSAGIDGSPVRERLVWLDHAHLAWRLTEFRKAVLVPPMTRPTLGVRFHNVAKISPATFSAYARSCGGFPMRNLVLKYGDRIRGLPALRNRYRHAFATGCAAASLQFRTEDGIFDLSIMRTMASVGFGHSIRIRTRHDDVAGVSLCGARRSFILWRFTTLTRGHRR